MRPSSLHALVPVAALLFAAAAASAQPVCTGSSHLLSWPDTDPIWELCWVRPSQSSGHFGSGLEIHDVSYQGQRVLKRAHSPILNVEYDPGGCGCFRDWTDEEATFIADNEIVPGYAEPTSPPLTTCDVGGSGGDVGTFTGVAVEKNLDEVILTSQMSAGWYRYTQKWTLHRDGRIQPFVGFTSVPASCTANFNHRHHQYWRLDFDIDGSDGDTVEEINAGVSPLTIQWEDARTWVDGDTEWRVFDSGSGLGYRIQPGAGDLLLPADSFSLADAWILAYQPTSEIDDFGEPILPPFQTNLCINKIDNFVTGESVENADLVFWYRGGAFHLAGELDDCDIVGPTLTPMGNWADTDLDGVNNNQDNCVDTPNAAQTDSGRGAVRSA